MTSATGKRPRSAFGALLILLRLCPNESPTTDVILVGHSLGGILAAEVALLPAHSPKSSEIYQLRILGILAFDTPFLGMHPGVVSTGLRSLFRPTPDMPPGTTQYENHLSPYPSNAESVTIANDSTVSDPFQAHSCDPNYNPSFANDIIMKNQKCWQSTLHFIHKYQNGLTKATKDYVTSYFEFGGCLADYPGLHNRYMHIRALEDVDELAQRKDEKGRFLRRVRFVNYYTACTGVSKRPGANKSPERPLETEMQHLSLDKSRSTSVAMRGDSTLVVGPRLSLEEHTDDEVIPKLLEHMDPTPMEDKDQHNDDLVEPDQTSTSTSEHPNTENLVTTDQSHEFSEDGNQEVEDDGLPPIPKLPSRPLDFDPSKYPAQDTLKLAQKEHARRVKSYERAKRDRERTIRDREKMVKKREKAALKQQEKEAKVAKKQHDMESKEKLKRRATLNPEVYDKDLERVIEEAKRSDQPLPKKKKDRKFCSLPPKDPATGERDTTWVRVYMEGMDEVVAHTSLFFGGETYEKLVGDTAGRIEEWVKEDATTRMMLQEMKSSPR